MRAAVTPSQWLWLIVALAAALRLFPIWFGLPYPHARPDEAVAIGHAMDVLDGQFNPRFFHWPSFIFYAFAAAFAVVSVARRLVSLSPELDPVTALLITSRGLTRIVTDHESRISRISSGRARRPEGSPKAGVS